MNRGVMLFYFLKHKVLSLNVFNQCSIVSKFCHLLHDMTKDLSKSDSIMTGMGGPKKSIIFSDIIKVDIDSKCPTTSRYKWARFYCFYELNT